MDAETLNKVIGSLLAALLLIFAPKVFIEMNLTGHGGERAPTGYTLPTGGETSPSTADATAEKAPPAFDAAGVAAAAETANADAGAKVFKKCKACHTADNGGANKLGPNLWGIVDRDIASTDGFKYSDGMNAKDGNWSLDALAVFLHSPKTFIAKTKMSFGGVRKDADLANLLAYLKTLK